MYSGIDTILNLFHIQKCHTRKAVVISLNTGAMHILDSMYPHNFRYLILSQNSSSHCFVFCDFHRYFCEIRKNNEDDDAALVFKVQRTPWDELGRIRCNIAQFWPYSGKVTNLRTPTILERDVKDWMSDLILFYDNFFVIG